MIDLNPQTKQGGFAIVLTLVLLSLLVIIALAVSSVSSINSELAGAKSYQTQARQNALLGLHIGIGKLQVAAGPDERITGMAGIVGIPEGSPYRHWTGIWRVAGEPIWLASGAKDGEPPTLNGESIALVSEGSVGANGNDKEWIEVGIQPIDTSDYREGHYAYWVGDEGAKISAVLLDNDAQKIGSEMFYMNAERLVSELSYTQDEGGRLISYSQLRYISGSSDLKRPFHSLTVTSSVLESSASTSATAYDGVVYGTLNINTTSTKVWQALLESKIGSTQLFDCGGKEESLADRISRDITSRAQPFVSIADLEGTDIIQAALDSRIPKIVTTTQDEIIDTLRPYLTSRSDTFRIRAYGDAMNPADAGVAGATLESVAYCEAIVQRTLEPGPGGVGKKFVITYFRWLGPDDI